MLKKKIKEIVDIFSNSTSGIFNALYNVVVSEQVSEMFDWLKEHEALDIDYYVSHSGEKYASRFYIEMLDHNKTIGDIASVVFNRFKDKWEKSYNALMMEYNPINNYDMKEKETVNSKITSSTDVNNETYGFGNPNPAPTDNGKSETVTSGSKDDNIRELERSGNIGVTTSAQLVSGELELRKNIFIESVMNDIDSIMCLKIY